PHLRAQGERARRRQPRLEVSELARAAEHGPRDVEVEVREPARPLPAAGWVRPGGLHAREPEAYFCAEDRDDVGGQGRIPIREEDEGAPGGAEAAGGGGEGG